MKLTISETSPVRLAIKQNTPTVLLMSVKDVSSMGERLPDYVGKVVVEPKVSEQVLLTANKSMRENIKVKEIPYYETSNPNGMTAIIGGV